MTAAEKVIQIAKAELGYREKRSNSSLEDKTANAGSGNWTKYARDLDAMTDFYNGAKNGYAWCDVFVDWCFYKAFGAETAKKLLCQPDRSAGAGCTYSLAYYNQHGQFYARNPKPGDQIFFGSVGNSSHTGLVTAVSGGKVHTIEGNTSDGVYERSYALGASNIAGYGRPDWSLVGELSDSDTGGSVTPEADPYGGVPTVQSTCTVELPEIYSGCTGEAAKAAQLLLIGRGYSCGVDGADGEFGAHSKNAVLRFQRAKRLEDDGVVGANTWRSLITG